jgi:hypothetical protein
MSKKLEVEVLNDVKIDDTLTQNKKLTEENKKLSKEVEKLLAVLETVNGQKTKLEEDFREALKVKDEAIKNEHQLRMLIGKYEESTKKSEEKEASLVGTLNSLANLFDICFTSLKDLNSILGVVERNSKSVLNDIELKVSAFNGPKE